MIRLPAFFIMSDACFERRLAVKKVVVVHVRHLIMMS
jgi:hypothetical protein